jgi:predicted  nucleic acid-binding Zn-ribbon protein
MNKLSRMRRSRESWKAKAVSRAEQLREHRKTRARQDKKIELLRARIDSLEQDLSLEKKSPPPRAPKSSG